MCDMITRIRHRSMRFARKMSYKMSKYPIGNLVNVSVFDLSWLSGAWYGQVGDDLIEEHWSGPAAGTLMGMFRWIY